jgi:nucleotide-binding universal stress UspA family protein
MAKKGLIKDIYLLTVIDIDPNALLEGVKTTAIYDTEMNKSREYLYQMQARLRAEGIEVKTEMLQGSTAQAIADYAKKREVELIIISTHGYSGVKRLIFGSVALSILHDSDIPILLS